MVFKSDARATLIGVISTIVSIPILAVLSWSLKIRPWQLSVLLAFEVIAVAVSTFALINGRGNSHRLAKQWSDASKDHATQIQMLERRFEGITANLEDLVSATATGIDESIRSLRSEVANFDWTYKAEEHRSVVYQKISDLACEAAVLRFDVMTVFRALDLPQALDDRSSRALQDYYRSIERKLQGHSGFKYRRAVILRQQFGVQAGPPDEKETRRLLQQLKAARPQFVDHFNRIRFGPDYGYPNEAQIELYRDDGRLFDLAFAVATARDDSAVSLAIELSISSTLPTEIAPGRTIRNPTQALALITIRTPRPEVQAAFAAAFHDLMTGQVAPRIPPPLIEEEWGTPSR